VKGKLSKIYLKSSGQMPRVSSGRGYNSSAAGKNWEREEMHKQGRCQRNIWDKVHVVVYFYGVRLNLHGRNFNTFYTFITVIRELNTSAFSQNTSRGISLVTYQPSQRMRFPSCDCWIFSFVLRSNDDRRQSGGFGVSLLPKIWGGEGVVGCSQNSEIV